MTQPSPTTRASSTPPFYRNVRVLRVVGQVAAWVVVLTALWWLFGNLTSNLEEQGISTSFDFLDDPAQFSPAFDRGFDDRSSVLQLMLVGLRNTILAASLGILLASVLGLIIGTARLSTNWLVAKLATLYVEVFRNTPPLILIIFFGFAIFTFGPFPIFRESTEIGMLGTDGNLLILNNTEWGIPSLATKDNAGLFLALVLVALVASVVVSRWRIRVNERTGQPARAPLWSIGTFLAIVALAYLALSAPVVISWPTLSENRRRLVGGMGMNFGFISITVALGLYTASHIAEIIRGSILAVPKGQTEAANALALTGYQRYRYVILPQALRIAIPPINSQFLNLTKNTSLGIAVAYAELTQLTKSSIGNGRPAPQSLLVLMLFYLTLTLSISFVMNRVNRRFQLVGR